MLSLTQFRKHLLLVFRIMKDTGETFEVAYKGVVYDVDVRRTDKVAKLVRPKREKQHELVVVEIDECERCGSIKMAGVCMSKDCSAVTVPGKS